MPKDAFTSDRILSQAKSQCKRGNRFGHPFNQETLLSFMNTLNNVFPSFDFL